MNSPPVKKDLEYLISHVFMPPKLPSKDDYTSENDLLFCSVVLEMIKLFQATLDDHNREVLGHVIGMLQKLYNSRELGALEPDFLADQIKMLENGEFLVIPIRSQNACVILRKTLEFTVFEIFEVDPPNSKVMGTIGKLVRNIPDKAIRIPTSTLRDRFFQQELALFLAQMDSDVLDSAATSKKAGTEVQEPRDTTDPHYITNLFFAILRGLPGASPANVFTVRKRIENDIVWDNAYLPWRRSPLWLILRVTIQTSVFYLTHSDVLYKQFMLYFTSKLLCLAVESNFSSYILHCLRAKVARRLAKLQNTMTDALANMALNAIQSATSLMEARWHEVQKDSLSRVQCQWAPKQLDIPGDTNLSLLKSESYIKECCSRVISGLPSLVEFRPVEHIRLLNTVAYPAFASEALSSALVADRFTTLADIEWSVQVYLDTWMKAHQHDENASTILSSCIETYASAARAAYEGNPEDISIMFLTVFDLWVALDKVTIHHHNLLREYSPEVSTTLLNPLLLRNAQSIQRYKIIQTYIQERQRNALGYSVFKETLRHSFTVRYFDSSSNLQGLKEQIESDARRGQQDKLAELKNQKSAYATLLHQAKALEHSYRIKKGNTMHHKKKKCEKCRKESAAAEMCIQVFEWPLSSDNLQAKRTVFELRPPPIFQIWRRTTYAILHDYCRPGLSDGPPVKPEALLESYKGLKRYTSGIDRITLGSSTKSFGKSHFKSVPISQATSSDIILPNGLNFQLYDINHRRWVTNSFEDCKIEPVCSWTLPSRSPYRNLQYAASGVDHTSNRVVAEQYAAPPELSLHEHIAFGTLRAGPKIQWLNILRELHARTLSLDKLETQILLLQTLWHIGEYHDDTLEWHLELFSPVFAHKLLLETEDIMKDIQENWQHLISLETLSRFLGRVLTFTDTKGTYVIRQAYDLLRRARKTAYRWMYNLCVKLQKDTEEDAIADLQLQLCAAALVCRSTYDVDESHIHTLLDGTEDIAVFLECLVRAHDNMPSDGLPAGHLRMLVARDRRLSYRTNQLMFSRIRKNRQSMDLAISRLWAAYSPGTSWNVLNIASSHEWLTTTTAKRSSQVHVNIMSGALLINGKPLNRLPKYMVQHESYKRLFGKQILDVVPSTRPYMEFCTRETYPGTDFGVHFAIIDGELIIEATNHSEIYQLIPHTILLSDFPEFLVLDHVHWLRLTNISRDATDISIEFRPLATPWVPSNASWILKSSPTDSFHLERYNNPVERLVDIRSRSFRMFSDYLRPLERSEYITMTTRISGDQRVLLDLPRHRLSFSLNDENQLESCDLREMIVDPSSSGCMFGLQNQLVLRPKNSLRMHLARSRCVLIPCGNVVYHISGHHMIVAIDTGESRYARHFKYDIDTNLGLLVFPGQSLEAEYYKIYLHALTSHCLPDPLTGRTGTEEALAELSSARCRSFQLLGTKERDLLFLIAGLAPTREWYPRHLNSMQVVRWRDTLSPFSQHWGFFTLSRGILSFAEKLAIFRPDKAGIYDFPPSINFASNDHLRMRAALRAARYFAPDYAYLEDDTHHDSLYPPINNRVRVNYQAMSPDAATRVSTLVQQWPSNLETVSNLWQRLSKAGKILGGSRETMSLSYDASFLRPNLSKLLIPLYNACSQRGRSFNGKIFALTFSLAAMAYSSSGHDLLDIIPTFLAFAAIPEFEDLPMSQSSYWSEFDLTRGTFPDRQVLFSWIKQYATPFEKTHWHLDLARRPGESELEFVARRQQAYSSYSAACNDETLHIAQELISQWSGQSENIDAPMSGQHGYITSGYMTGVRDLFRHWYRNQCLRSNVAKIQNLLDLSRTHHGSNSLAQSILQEEQLLLSRAPGSASTRPRFFISLRHIAENLNVVNNQSWTPIIPAFNTRPPKVPSSSSFNPTVSEDLANLVRIFRLRETKLHKIYADALEKSRDTLYKENKYIASGRSSRSRRRQDVSLELTPDILQSSDRCLNHMLGYLQQAKDQFSSFFWLIQDALKPSDVAGKAISAAGCWPRITNRTVLQLLSHSSGLSLGGNLKKILLSLGQSLVRVQQAQRCIDWAIQGSFEELERELQNDTQENDQTLQDLDWLLIQIEGNFIARPLQRKVALEMISPSSQDNTLLQLNMGEGKTSVIVPLVAARLADKDKLVRVVVLKPLKNQMFSSLASRLGGLADRRVFYVPFSRDIRITSEIFHDLDYLLNLCRKEGGILVTQPEHVLSLQLMTVDIMLNSSADNTLASQLRKKQSWLRIHARDILDESDEILSVEYQLVYTNGRQTSLEHHPARWLLIQHILGLVKRHSVFVSSKHPSGLEVSSNDDKPGSFPIIRVLDKAAWRALLYKIGHELVYGAKSEFRLCSKETRSQAFGYITNSDFNVTNQQQIQSSLGSSLWTTLLLYRGLLAHGILEFSFKQKRWRVDYGLDPSRTLLAVPYKAKDVPSPRADFGHPDVALILTSLSYYYGGLTDDQVALCFEMLFKLDNPVLEYENWTRDHISMPEGLRHITGINWKDIHQRHQYLLPSFRRSHSVIDFYLSHVVFPKEAKQFPFKLSTSAWDLSERTVHVKTGFSGTNDNQYLLPTMIHQLDPVNQLSTNAKVMAYLLQPENNFYETYGSVGEPLTGRQFLKFLTQLCPEVRVLLDVGAQMLDMRNEELVNHWLSICGPKIQAAVFFDESNDLCIMGRDGNITPFSSSPFNEKLDVCVVYLDDAHTRGTDLKLSSGSRAAVTLGPKVTKDRLVQGCMRMRKLGHGQSVIFLAPLEIDKKIRAATSKQDGDPIASSDVLLWAMSETCDRIAHYIGYWAHQGVNYVRRQKASHVVNSEYGTLSESDVATLRHAWIEQEARSLEDMYAAKVDSDHLHAAFNIPDLRDHLNQLGANSIASSLMDEEQEREVSDEMEQQRQLERPPYAQPAPHNLHPDVRQLIVNGVLVLSSVAFIPPLSSMQHLDSQNSAWSSRILATADFSKTIIGRTADANEFLRPVNWIISLQSRQSGQPPTLIILSPFEVNELMSQIRRSKFVNLHMFTPRSTEAMKTLEDLQFHCIPPLSSSWKPPSPMDVAQFSLWAGQLYLRDYEAYETLCQTLGLVSGNIAQEDGVWDGDGFVVARHRDGKMANVCRFERSPVSFIKTLIGLRRKGMDYRATHVGRILHREALTQEDFESATA